MIKISVIIPVYNAGKYLRECLDSVIGQTLQDIEIICVDDGSTDSSLSVLQKYAAKDTRLKIVAQANQGAAAARNVGMAVAQGEYLAFLDSDDLYCSEALQKAYNRAISVNADMVVFEADFFDDKQGLLRTERLETRYLAGLQEFSAYAIPEFIFQISSCNTWNKLYKREFVQRSGLQYQELKTANDLCFVYSALACAGKIAVLKEPLVRHRVLHSGNLQSVKVESPLDFMAALERLKQNLQQFGLWEQLKRSYLNSAMFHCLYNWQTLDKQGKSRIAAKSQEITELLEFAEHSADYYYSRNDYILMCKVVRFNREGDSIFMGKLKNMLKHILPPPVNAFNREVAGMKQMMLELNAGLNAQQRQLGEQYTKQMTMLDNKYAKQLAVFAETNKQQLELLRQQQIQIAEIEQRQQKIQERLRELDNLAKLDCLQTNLEASKKDILNNQSEQFAGLQKEMQLQADNSAGLINGISEDLQQIDAANKVAFINLNNVVKNVETVIPNKLVYWNNAFERRMVAANWGDVTKQPDFADKFLRLTDGLDEESVEKIVRMLLRLSKYLNSDAEKIDLFTRAEQEELRLLKENFDSEILKLSDNLYAYKKYLLPVNHFESSVFYFKHGLAEIETLDKVEGKSVVDVGGFIGDSVLILSELKPDKIYTFEAVPENYELLKQTVELNHVSNVVAEKLALGAEAGRLKMNVYGSMSTSIERKGVNYKDEIEVPVITLDEYVEKHHLKVGLIKVDIEGGEPAFLAGAKSTICEQKPILLLSIYHNAHDFFELKPLIESWNLGYKFKIHKPTYGNTTSETLLLAEIK